MQSEKNENHDGRVQRRNVIKQLAAVSQFSVSNFKVRHERCLGSGSFGQVYTGSFGFKQKIQCVVKIAKKEQKKIGFSKAEFLEKFLMSRWTLTKCSSPFSRVITTMKKVS